MALQGNDAALVAAALTQAECTLMAGYMANRAIPDEAIANTSNAVERLYKHFLDFALSHEPKLRR